MKKTLYVSDLDGTLLNKNSQLSTYSKETINNLIERGISFTYATARSYNSASILTSGLNLKLPLIIYSGVMIFDAESKKPIFANYFSNEEIDFLKSFFILNDIYPLVYAIVGKNETVSWLEGKQSAGMQDYLDNRRNDKRLRPVSNRYDVYSDKIFYFTCIDEYEKLLSIYNMLRDNKNFSCVFQQELYKTEYWLEIMPANSSKANALLRLKEMLGFESVICFGDSLNDISMFEVANESYATSNAIDLVKQNATAVIGSNDDDGVAVWLKDNAKE